MTLCRSGKKNRRTQISGKALATGWWDPAVAERGGLQQAITTSTRRRRRAAVEVRLGSRVDGALARTFLRCCRLVGCGHVSGLFVRRGWPLALMLSADQVPILRTHSMMR